jgi:hypothetical protein
MDDIERQIALWLFNDPDHEIKYGDNVAAGHMVNRELQLKLYDTATNKGDHPETAQLSELRGIINARIAKMQRGYTAKPTSKYFTARCRLCGWYSSPWEDPDLAEQELQMHSEKSHKTDVVDASMQDVDADNQPLLAFMSSRTLTGRDDRMRRLMWDGRKQGQGMVNKMSRRSTL